jgi:hypothetical protein
MPWRGGVIADFQTVMPESTLPSCGAPAARADAQKLGLLDDHIVRAVGIALRLAPAALVSAPSKKCCSSVWTALN